MKRNRVIEKSSTRIQVKQPVLSKVAIESLSYLYEIDSIANELNKFVRYFTLSILDLTTDLRIASASLLQFKIPCVYKVKQKLIQESNLLQGQTNLDYSICLDQALGKALAYECSLGMVCIDTDLSDAMYFDLLPALEIVKPPIMLLGSSQYEQDIKNIYRCGYAFKTRQVSVDREIGRIYYDRRPSRRG